MEYLLLVLVALAASTLTFFSGFGLGTVLLPVFAIFFPAPQAVAATAVVHFLNNGLKFGLLRGHTNWPIVIRFGIPGVLAAPLGALTLDSLSDLDAIATYGLFGRTREVSPVNIVLAALLLVLGILETIPRTSRRGVEPRYLPLGGFASGFLGGLAGLQGALRSAFLIRTGLEREAFIATGVAVALLVDASRLAVYAGQGTLGGSVDRPGVLAVGVAAAFVGALIGNRLLPKVTLRGVQILVGTLLVGLAVALGMGLL
jgi:uncharacterized protein